jgi:hypothetical protein
MLNRSSTSVVNCQARAYDYLVRVMGGRPDTLTWDSKHCLQGHAHLGGHEVVVIATRDSLRQPVVLTAPNWDAVRRSTNDQRRELINLCAITDRSGFASALAA